MDETESGIIKRHGVRVENAGELCILVLVVFYELLSVHGISLMNVSDLDYSSMILQLIAYHVSFAFYFSLLRELYHQRQVLLLILRNDCEIRGSRQ